MFCVAKSELISYPFHLPPVLSYQEHCLKECCMFRALCQTRNKYEPCPIELSISENQRLSESERRESVSDPTELRFVFWPPECVPH